MRDDINSHGSNDSGNDSNNHSGNHIGNDIVIGNGNGNGSLAAIRTERLADLMREALGSYAVRGDQSAQAWLAGYLASHAALWPDAQAATRDAAEIVAGVADIRRLGAEVTAQQAQGVSRGRWLADQVTQGARAGGVTQLGAYASQFDKALSRANDSSAQAIRCMDGRVSQCRNLDGFIAEHHHANTFNLDAAAKGSALRARVLEPAPGNTYGRNSMDIGVYDANGKLVSRYQIKYGADADASAQLFERGDYRGQRKLVPEGQAVEGSTDLIEVDGVRSRPLSKEDAKAAQEAAQQRAESRTYDWRDMDKAVFARQLGKQVAVGAAVAAAFHGVRVLGRRAWNWLNGRENPAASEDLKEFFTDTARSTAQAGTQVAVSGAMLVAARSGWLGEALKATPALRIAGAAMLALENAKVLFKLGSGEIDTREALDRMGAATATTLGSIAAAGEGATAGAAIGAVLGPVGSAVGAVVGGIAGACVAEKLYEGAKCVASAAGRTIATVTSGITSIASSAWSVVSSVFSW